MLYLEQGLQPIPLPPRSKRPDLEDWQHLRLTPDVLDQHFPPERACNVGILNGAASNNIVDVDLDCREALRAAPLLLPATGWIFGHTSCPRSHWIFKTDVPFESAQDAYKNLAGEMLVELRGSGGQTVFPPSIHRETGEPIAWESFTSPAEVPLVDLQHAVRAVAAAALLAQHWPAKGSRDNAAMALAGGLVRGGWDEEQVGHFVRAVAVAAGDEEARMRAGKARPTSEKLVDGRKVTGWPRLEELLGARGSTVVRKVREWLEIGTHAEAREVPIHETPSWPDPPASEAFYGLPGRIVNVISPASEADRAALLLQVLITFGNAIGRSAHFVVEADTHYPNEFVVLVGRTSKARKGTSWGWISRLFNELDGQWADQVESGCSSGEGVIWRIRDPIQTRARVRERGQPVRYEDVEADPGISDKRLLIYEPEYANVLKQTERQGNTLSAVLRQSWDAIDLGTLTKNSPAHATAPHVSLIGHVTVTELQRYLTTTEAANGFGNRHLWLCTQRSKELPEGGSVDPDAWKQLKSELTEALNIARTVKQVTRDEEARALWRKVYGPLSAGKPGLAGSLLARAEAHAMRLAMMYALMDRSATIGAAHLLAALAVTDYVESSVYFIFGDSLGDPVADDLLRLLRSRPDGATRSELLNFFGRNQSSDRIGRALGLLLQHQLARCERKPAEGRGRPAEVWFAVIHDRKGS
jgi:hypothetical protein